MYKKKFREGTLSITTAATTATHIVVDDPVEGDLNAFFVARAGRPVQGRETDELLQQVVSWGWLDRAAANVAAGRDIDFVDPAVAARDAAWTRPEGKGWEDWTAEERESDMVLFAASNTPREYMGGISWHAYSKKVSPAMRSLFGSVSCRSVTDLPCDAYGCKLPASLSLVQSLPIDVQLQLVGH